MDTLGFFKYHSLQCDGHTADVIFQGTAIGINYKMAKRNIPVNRFLLRFRANFCHSSQCFSIPRNFSPVSSFTCNGSRPKNQENQINQRLPASSLFNNCFPGSDLSPVLGLLHNFFRVIKRSFTYVTGVSYLKQCPS